MDFGSWSRIPGFRSDSFGVSFSIVKDGRSPILHKVFVWNAERGSLLAQVCLFSGPEIAVCTPVHFSMTMATMGQLKSLTSPVSGAWSLKVTGHRGIAPSLGLCRT